MASLQAGAFGRSDSLTHCFQADCHAHWWPQADVRCATKSLRLYESAFHINLMQISSLS